MACPMPAFEEYGFCEKCDFNGVKIVKIAKMTPLNGF